ncbi:hypothetical protein ACFQU7_41830 [Pseudoroseomonas wenyumeiae]
MNALMDLAPGGVPDPLALSRRQPVTLALQGGGSSALSPGACWTACSMCRAFG